MGSCQHQIAFIVGTSSSERLSTAQLSKVSDIIPAQHSLRFCTEYLGIDRNEYSIFEHDNKSNHYNTISACVEVWRNRTEAERKDVLVELHSILDEIRQTHGWFPSDDIATVFAEKPRQITVDRKLFIAKNK